MSCIKPSELQNDLSQAMENGKDLLDAISKYKELIATANKVFKEEWSHAVTNTTIDFSDFNSGKYYVGCQAKVKVQLSNGLYHEDIGYSSVDASTKGLAFEKARSISITNALMKALSCFLKFKTEIEHSASNQNSTPNISNILRTEVVLKRSITPPPAAQSTPKIPKSPATINGKQEKRIKIAGPEDNDKIDEVVEEADFDIIFDKSKELPCANVISVLCTSNPAGTISTSLTKEERKRVQREKQEEFKRLMKEKEEREKQNRGPDTN